MSMRHARVVHRFLIEKCQEILTEKYGKEHPSSTKKEDFQVGIQLFTKLAILSTPEPDSPPRAPKLSERKVEVISEATEALPIEKIHKFAKKHSYRFWEMCATGFPFSMLESSTSEAALRATLESRDSAIVHLMDQNPSVWLTEHELESRFGQVFKHLNLQAIKEALLRS